MGINQLILNNHDYCYMLKMTIFIQYWIDNRDDNHVYANDDHNRDYGNDDHLIVKKLWLERNGFRLPTGRNKKREQVPVSSLSRHLHHHYNRHFHHQDHHLHQHDHHHHVPYCHCLMKVWWWGPRSFWIYSNLKFIHLDFWSFLSYGMMMMMK